MSIQPGTSRTTESVPALARAYLPVLKSLLNHDGELFGPCRTGVDTDPEDWDLHLAHGVYTALTVGLADRVLDTGFDPDILPEPTSRLLAVSPVLGEGVRLTLSAVDVDTDLTEAAKQVPGCAWNAAGRRWDITVIPPSLEPLRALVRHHDVLVAPDAVTLLREVAQKAADDPTAFALGTVSVTGQGRGSTPEVGRVQVILRVPTPAVADALKRVSGMRWDGTAGAYRAPGSRLREIVALARDHHLVLDASAEEALAVLDAPLVYDGTLDGLRGVPLTDLHCVDEKRAEKFAAYGLKSVFDVLMHVPLRYLDRANLTPIRSLEEGQEVGLLATITALNVDPRRRMVRVQVADGTGKLGIIYFNAVWQAKRFRVGDEVTIYGKVESWQGAARKVLSIANPIMDPVGGEALPVIPIYPQSAKARVTTWEIQSAIAEVLRRLGTLIDPLPDHIREELSMAERQTALASVHLPATLDAAEVGRNRLAFDELFRMQAGLLLTKNKESSEVGIAHKPTGQLTDQFLSKLPYKLTGAQTRAVKEIKAGMVEAHPLHTLIQGDVGSGKSSVALITLLMGVESGYQGALMAPTEILATQLYAELSERAQGLVAPDGTPLHIEFFSNKLRGKKRDAALERLASGETNVAVGTHALLVDDVTFSNLGVVVVDEQHRFGVEQRASLRAKGPLLKSSGESVHVRPDMLVMTATPIPRTSALAVFGDLDMVVLDELPPGRTPIATSWMDSAPELRDPKLEPWSLIREQVEQGRQAYVVCPLVEESEKMQAASAVETYEELQAGALRGLRVGLVHGQQGSEERTTTMNAFRDGDLDVLVATTVIEVGVNVPNATVIAILDSSRFGIAQLHQLRGRVGRGSHASSCVLVGRCVSSDARTRMQALCDSTDGFYLSEVDLLLRGHGSVFGSAQSGQSDLRVADLERDKEILESAREAALTLLADDPGLARRPALRQEISAVLDDEALEWLQKS